MIKKSILIWMLIIPLAILNGGIREKIMFPLLGQKYALPLSGILLCFLIFLVSYFFIPKIGKKTARDYLKIGVLWLILTILFETIGSLLGDISLNEILRSYDMRTGNLWLIVVVFTGLAPLLVAKMRNLI